MQSLRENTHKNQPQHKFLHWVGWSDPRPDDQATQCLNFQSKSGWSGPGPDDPDLVTCERPEWPRSDDPALYRMIRIWEFQCVFCLFYSHPGWSGGTPDDPGSTRKHTTVTFGGGSIYTPSPPSFTSLSLSDQPRLQSIHSFTSLHPRAWFLQGNT